MKNQACNSVLCSQLNWHTPRLMEAQPLTDGTTCTAALLCPPSVTPCIGIMWWQQNEVWPTGMLHVMYTNVRQHLCAFANCSPLSQRHQYPGQKSCPDREQWYNSETKCKSEWTICSFNLPFSKSDRSRDLKQRGGKSLDLSSFPMKNPLLTYQDPSSSNSSSFAMSIYPYTYF